LDAQGFCVGCLRSIDEIASWSSMSGAEQWQVIAAIAERRKAAEAKGPKAKDDGSANP
jgi:uncharacterized protein